MTTSNDVLAEQSEPTIPRCSSGSAGLDDVLGGGLPVGHFYLLEGEPGTGKTTLALQFVAEGIERGEKVFSCREGPRHGSAPRNSGSLLENCKYWRRIGRHSRATERTRRFSRNESSLDGTLLRATIPFPSAATQQREATEPVLVQDEAPHALPLD